MTIEALDVAAATREAGALVELLCDAVSSGASVGFLLPLGEGEVTAYWQSVVAGVGAGSRILVVARADDGEVVGSAQIDLASRPTVVIAPRCRR